ncbi:MAG: PucR family transcriptional regulator [Mycobacterium sp.]
MGERGIGLGQLLLALDATLVSLVQAPRGLDLPVASAALVDSDDVRLGLSAGAGAADVFFLLGISHADTLTWLDRQLCTSTPAAIFAKEPSDDVVRRAANQGVAVVAVEPRARWERTFRLVNHVLEHHGDRTDPESASGTDLFGLAQSIADRTRGMVSIEDAQSHVLAYSASGDEADELRRLSILGRAGPAEYLQWLGQWGVFDALRAGAEVVRVDARPELGLRPRMAIGIHTPSVGRRHAPGFAGTIWVQQGARAFADDADDVLRGASVLAARIMSRLAATPSSHLRRVQELLGLSDGDVDVTSIAREVGIPAGGRAAVIGFETATPHQRLDDVLALSASAFHADAQVAGQDARVYVVLPRTSKVSAITSWVRGTIATLRAELDLDLRAVIAAPLPGLAGVATARIEVDRVLDSAARHPSAIGAVTSLAEARTTVALDEIVTWIGGNQRLVDPRIAQLRDHDPVLVDTLRAYLDSFGDVAAAAQWLHVHPNTVRYRVRRIEQVMTTTLADPDMRLLLSLSLRAAAWPTTA